MCSSTEFCFLSDIQLLLLRWRGLLLCLFILITIKKKLLLSFICSLAHQVLTSLVRKQIICQDEFLNVCSALDSDGLLLKLYLEGTNSFRLNIQLEAFSTAFKWLTEPDDTPAYNNFTHVPFCLCLMYMKIYENRMQRYILFPGFSYLLIRKAMVM